MQFPRQDCETSDACRELQLILDAVPATIWYKDAHNRFLKVNKAAAASLGLQAEEIEGKTCEELFPSEAALYYADDLAVIRSGQPRLGIVERMRTASGETKWMCTDKIPCRDAQGQITGVIVFAVDITATKQAEESLTLHSAIVRNMAEGAFLVRASDGMIVYANPHFERMFGYEPGEIIGKPVSIVNAPTDRTPEEVSSEIRGILNRTGEWHGRVHSIKKDGTLFWCYANVSAFDHLEHGKVWLSVHMDITEHLRAETALQASNQKLADTLKKLQDTQSRLIRQERFGALEQMASGIAHDFNNALMPVLGYSDLLLTAPNLLDNRDETIELLERIHTGATNATETVRRLREFYRPGNTVRFGPVDLARIIQDTVALTQPRWKADTEAKGIIIDLRMELTSVPPVKGDVRELSRLLTNLIINAVDAIPQRGTITIRAYPQVQEQKVNLEVIDTGIGMTEEIRQRCLDPFFSTKGGRGVGLGLSVSYGIVQRHKGLIDIHSEPNQGTRVVVQLPIAEAVARPPQPGADRPPEVLTALPPVRVLFVDDEEPVRLVMNCYLEADGHIVTLATHAREALTLFKAERFDLVILDRAMPEMNGDVLATAIKTLSPLTPVIMLTGFGDTLAAQDEHPQDVDKILAKPLTRENLRVAMLEVMLRKQQTEEPK